MPPSKSRRGAGKVTLFCLIHGQSFRDAFPVQINKVETVGMLKEFIINKQPQTFKDIDSKNLQLWKASIPYDNQEALRNFPLEDDKVLAPVSKISKVFPQKPPEEHIHIIVQAPMQGPQRVPKRKLSVTDVPLQSTEVEFERLYECWKWWQEVRKMKIEEGLITFTTNILGRRRYGSTILVRDIYKDLYGMVTCETGSTDIDSFIITGTPGIGKSIFGFYLLCRYANEYPDADILWENAYTMISLHRNGSITNTIRCKPSNMRSLDPSGHVDNTIKMISPTGAKLWILDATEPNGAAPFVLLTSPKYSCYKELEKAADVEVLGMPVWEFAELKRLWEIKFSSVDYKGWIDRFEKWGGVPRSVLEKITAYFQSRLEYNISSLNLDSCLASIGALRYDSEQVNGTVLHTTVTKDGEYCDFRILFASLYVEKAVMRYYQQGMQQQVIKFLDNSRDNNVFGSMRGCIFEMLAHPMLARGGRFNAYHLGNPNKGVVQIELPKTELCAFKSIDEVKAGFYYRSSSKNFESIDALYILDRVEGDHDKMFQITVGKEHPIKVNGLEKILSRLRPSTSTSTSTSASTSTKIRLYFVVPKDIFPAFTEVQTYVTKKEEPHKRVPQEIRDNVEQWALELDYSSFSSTE